MSQPKLTGKRRSMDIKEMDYPAKTVPLVPDLSAAQKAMIHEELARSLLLAETSSVERMTSRATVLQQQQPAEPSETAQAESKSRKLGRKLKGLFINDQTKPPSRKHSLDTRHSSSRAYITSNDDEIDEDDLYHFDGRSKHLWGGPGN